MEEKRLDFDAPLLSVRRARAAPIPVSLSRSTLPSHVPDLNSGPVRQHPGFIPFSWEQTPGLPKNGSIPASAAAGLLLLPPAAPNPPPCRILINRESDSSDGIMVDCSATKGADSAEDEGRLQPVSSPDEDAASSSSAGSPFMTCSTSSSPDAREASESFVMDPETKDFMMGRFLPAAQAMATGLPQRSFRKPPRRGRYDEEIDDEKGLRPLALLSYGQRTDSVLCRCTHEQEEVCSSSTFDEEEEEEDDEEGYDDAGHLRSKSCGLIPRFFLNNSLCLLNPLPGMEFGSRQLQRNNLNSKIKASHRRLLNQLEDENFWEAVYKYKLGQENHSQGEERSKLTSESNRLTYWSDSQTHDGSSSFRRSSGAVTSPYRNEIPRSLSSEGKKFLGVPVKETESRKTASSDSIESDGRNYSVLTTSSSGEHGSGSMSPAIDITLYVDSVHTLDTPNSSALHTTADTDGMIGLAAEYTDTAIACQRIEPSLVPDACQSDATHSKLSNIVDLSLSFPERSICKETDEVDCRKYGAADGLLPSKVEDNTRKDTTLSLSLLPPPLPKSPSESWLRRTLPSISSKNASMRSMLGVQFQPREQSFKTSMKELKHESNLKPFIESIPLVKHAEVIPRPASTLSEI